MNLLKDLSELQEAGIINSDKAQEIKEYYEQKNSNSSQRLLIAFGILGALLIGLGIILMVAHNWDNFSTLTKTVLAFLPLVIGQAFSGYSILRKSENTAWIESSAAFTICAIGASIALVGQIYNIPGNLSSFLLTWVLLSIPLVYLMKSSVASLLCIIGITFYGTEANYFTFGQPNTYYYWLGFLLLLPHYLELIRKRPNSNFTSFHHWLIPISLTISLGTLATSAEEYLFLAYMNLFGVFYMIGSSSAISRLKAINSGYRFIGFVGTIGLLLSASFDWFWEETLYMQLHFTSTDFLAAAFTSVLAIALFSFQLSNSSISKTPPLSFVFVLFILAFVFGQFTNIAWLINLMILALGITTMRRGEVENNLLQLNTGLLIITALIACRFFDTNFSFVVRGLMFLAVGTGFFVANYRMLKKKRSHES